MNPLIGIDPEVFLTTSDRSKLVSAIGKFGGSKDHPLPFGPAGFALQEDNVALEFNIPPTDKADAFVKNVNFALEELEKRAGALNLKLAFKASAVFPDEELNNEAARRFGCDPDYNAWTMQENFRPDDVNPNLRSCGGHIHVGVGNWDMEKKLTLIRAMDLHLGIPSLHLDKDKTRRQLYGKAGCFREKPYGVEYRTLSNFWLQSDKLKKWVFDKTQQAVAWVEDGGDFEMEDAICIQQAINEGDKSALKFVEQKFPKCTSINFKT